MISFIEFADYVVKPVNTLCENGRIENLEECKDAANQLGLYFESDEEASGYPGGCYAYDNYTVYFNKNFDGASDGDSNPICDQGK